MNGKFESNSNDYNESNLNRLHSVLGAGVVGGLNSKSVWSARLSRLSIDARGGIAVIAWRSVSMSIDQIQSASVARASAATPGLCLREDLAYRMRSCGYNFRSVIFLRASSSIFSRSDMRAPSLLRRR